MHSLTNSVFDDDARGDVGPDLHLSIHLPLQGDDDRPARRFVTHLEILNARRQVRLQRNSTEAGTEQPDPADVLERPGREVAEHDVIVGIPPLPRLPKRIFPALKPLHVSAAVLVYEDLPGVVDMAVLRQDPRNPFRAQDAEVALMAERPHLLDQKIGDLPLFARNAQPPEIQGRGERRPFTAGIRAVSLVEDAVEVVAQAIRQAILLRGQVLLAEVPRPVRQLAVEVIEIGAVRQLVVDSRPPVTMTPVAKAVLEQSVIAQLAANNDR